MWNREGWVAMVDNKELVLLFSGGTDSTYLAILMNEKYEKIHLITYDRLGFLNTENAAKSAQALQNKFGIEKFSHRVINIDRLFKKLSYGNYIKDIFNYNYFMLLTCGLCKLAMHWQTIIYCLENDIKEVCDGSNQEMNQDPSQNEEIIKEMQLLYDGFGILYFTPIYYESIEVRERTVFDSGLSLIPSPKWTRFSFEKQPYCSQEYLFSKFFDYAHTNWKGQNTRDKAEKYEKKLHVYHREKRDFIKEQIYRYFSQKDMDK